MEVNKCQTCTRPNVLLVLDLLWIILQEPHDRALLQLSRGHDVVCSYIESASLLQVRGQRTRGDHGLNEVADIAQHNAEALDGIHIARLGLHGLDLHALQHRIVNGTATRLEYASARC